MIRTKKINHIEENIEDSVRIGSSSIVPYSTRNTKRFSQTETHLRKISNAQWLFKQKRNSNKQELPSLTTGSQRK